MVVTQNVFLLTLEPNNVCHTFEIRYHHLKVFLEAMCMCMCARVRVRVRVCVYVLEGKIGLGLPLARKELIKPDRDNDQLIDGY